MNASLRGRENVRERRTETTALPSNNTMALAADKIRSQPRNLRKSIKKLQRDSSIDRVHQLRTRSRRMEATLHALALDSDKNLRRLLKTVKPVRKKAGKVRDMDVLTHFASRLHVAGEDDCSVTLLEHLGGERKRDSRKLQKTAAAQANEINRRLKRCTDFFDEALASSRDKSGKRSNQPKRWAEEAAATALQVSAELRQWPALNRSNLHPFRLKVKELRYVLQLADQEETHLIDELGEIKDAIGEWHDWEELAAIAKSVIQHNGCKLLKEIHSIANHKFDHALSLANHLKNESLASPTRKPNRSASGIGKALLESAQ